MRKLLIVSPRFPPNSAPDMHRVRTSLRYYRRFGWEPTVLCLTPESPNAVADPNLLDSIPKDIAVVRVDAWDERWCRRFHFGHEDYRSWPLFRAGKTLLERNRFDLVFFSTTMFSTFIMGPIWKARYGCKLVYDFQDPWYHGGALPYTKATAPGSWWKYRMAQSAARFLERHSLKSADHVISVSEGYVKNLSTRYPWLRPDDFTVLPFGVATDDYETGCRRGIEPGPFKLEKGTVRWVYAGRGGADMNPTLAVLFEQLRDLKTRAPQFTARLRVYFVGTNYAPANRTRKLIEPLAAQFGVGDLVQEHSERIPYYQAISMYANSDAILLIGSNSPSYTASKLFNCVASKKPVLALFHRDSLVVRLASRFPNVALATFTDPTDPEFARSVRRGIEWLRSPQFDVTAIDRELAPWSAEELTRAQCEIFSRICEN